MNTTEIFLIAMVMIFAIPYITWRVLRTDTYAPLVVVQIIGGVLLGPGLLGAAFPDYHAFVFQPQVVSALNGIAWWAVMLYVWLAGLELDLAEAWKCRSESLVVAGFALFVPLGVGALAAIVLLAWGPEWMGSKAQPWQFVLGVGMGCAVTALPILALLLEKLGILRTALGQRLLRYASFDDIAIWSVLALILLDWNRIGRQMGFVVCFLPAAWMIRALMQRLQPSDRWYVALIWLASISLAADWAGLHFMVGAFLAGVVLDAHWFGQERLDMFRDHILFAVMPVFFLSTGLRTTWSVGADTVFIAAGLLLVVSVGGKLLGVMLAGRMLKWPSKDARIVGWLLQTKGLIEIVFANILLDKNIISGETFTALLLMAVVSTMLAIPMVRAAGLPVKSRVDATPPLSSVVGEKAL